MKDVVADGDAASTALDDETGAPWWEERDAAAESASALRDRQEYVLALFKYGLVDSPQDLAVVMSITEQAARELCDALVVAGLLDAPAEASRG